MPQWEALRATVVDRFSLENLTFSIWIPFRSLLGVSCLKSDLSPAIASGQSEVVFFPRVPNVGCERVGSRPSNCCCCLHEIKGGFMIDLLYSLTLAQSIFGNLRVTLPSWFLHRFARVPPREAR
ncbi:hypothetical protein HRR88_007781 [Exophiala dermatitidis]|nr:hypothetical protein HRR84_004441 [Exophiala dermatitidis]KAJ4615287.1 hypothetical protein HRR88_007781 [Exophiala dermatitidis]KAJ4665946.1 hypothetical protein HRR92_007772 [Exophiala dermatitidis]KAJ4666440.1 hypothetical protein HRR95_008263 [Exophiala dermatitidis]